MKRIIVSFAILMASVLSAEYASAQAGARVKIHNVSGQHRRVCMYKDNDTAMASPSKCFSMHSNQKVEWDRKRDRSYFRIRVMRKRGSIYQTVSFRRLPGKTSKIDVTSRGIVYGPIPPKPPVAENKVKIWDLQIAAFGPLRTPPEKS